MVFEITYRVEGGDGMNKEKIMELVHEGKGVVMEYGWVEPKKILMEYLQDQILQWGPLEREMMSGAQKIEFDSWCKLHTLVKEQA